MVSNYSELCRIQNALKHSFCSLRRVVEEFTVCQLTVSVGYIEVLCHTAPCYEKHPLEVTRLEAGLFCPKYRNPQNQTPQALPTIRTVSLRFLTLKLKYSDLRPL